MSIHRALRALKSWLVRPSRRRRKALGLALLGVCAAGSQSASRAQDEGRRITISLDADEAKYSEAESAAVVTGNVRLKASDLPGPVPEVSMTTDRLQLSLDTGDIEAPGGATFVTPRLEVTGDDLHYNLRSQDFRALNARSVIRVPLRDREVTVYARSDSVQAVEADVEFHKAAVTTCDREKPHYALKARRVRVNLDTEELFIYGGGLSLYGVHIPLVSKFSTKITRRGSEGLLVIPMLGYSQREGVYVPFKKGFSVPGDPIRTVADVKFTQRHLIAGSLVAEHSRPGFRAWATAARRLEMDDDISRRLVYDALPELGVEVTTGGGASVLSGRLMGGAYRDEDVLTGQRAREGAATLRADWDWRPERADGAAGLWAGAGLRGSVYTSGDSYRTVDFRVGGAAPLWSGARGQLELRHHIIGGHTPFEFDDIDLKTEAALALDTPLVGAWGLRLTGRYDIHRSSLRDYTVDLRRQVHCLTWHLRYRKVGSRIGVGVDLTDLIDDGEPTLRRRRGQPRPAVGAAVAQAAEREHRPALPDVLTAASVPRETVPSEFQLAGSHRQRAPDATPPFSSRPPPSLRLAYTGAF